MNTMKKLVIIVVLSIAVQIVVTTSRAAIEKNKEISNEATLTHTKRFRLIQLVYESLRKSVWPAEVYPKMIEYMNELKEWTDNDGALKKSTVYEELQEGIENCLNLLEQLTTDPDNCHKQLALRINHYKVKSQFKSLHSEKLQQIWSTKYMDFMVQLRAVMSKSSEKFFTILAAGLNRFIHSLDELEVHQEVAILQWNDKFKQEKDDMRKQTLLIEFMSLFPKERRILEAKCKIQYSNGL